jgi:hypothetical protein
MHATQNNPGAVWSSHAFLLLCFMMCNKAEAAGVKGSFFLYLISLSPEVDDVVIKKQKLKMRIDKQF